MALEDYVESEVAIAAAATAAILSPRVRGVLRTGAVYGLAGVLMAGDALGTFARGVARGVQQTAAAGARTQEVPQQPQAARNGGARGEPGRRRTSVRTAHHEE